METEGQVLQVVGNEGRKGGGLWGLSQELGEEGTERRLAWHTGDAW